MLDEPAWESGHRRRPALRVVPGRQHPAAGRRPRPWSPTTTTTSTWPSAASDPDPASDPRPPRRPRRLATSPGRLRRHHHRHLQRRAPRLPVPRQPARRADGRRRSARSTGSEDFSWDAIWDVGGADRPSRATWSRSRSPSSQLRFPRTDGAQTWGFDAFRCYPRNVRHRISSSFTDRHTRLHALPGDQDHRLRRASTPGPQPRGHPDADRAAAPTRATTFPTAGSRGRRRGARARRHGALGDHPEPDPQRARSTPTSRRSRPTPPSSTSTPASPSSSPRSGRSSSKGADFFQHAAPGRLHPHRGRSRVGRSSSPARKAKNAFGVFVAQDDGSTTSLIPANQGSQPRLPRRGRPTPASCATGATSASARPSACSTPAARATTTTTAWRASTASAASPSPTPCASSTCAPTPSTRMRSARRLDGQTSTPSTATASTLEYDHIRRDWSGFARYQDLDRGFRADSGFMPRVDVRTGEAQFERCFYGTGRPGTPQSASASTGPRTEDHDGTLTDEELEVFGTLNGPLPVRTSDAASCRRTRSSSTAVTFDLDRQTLLLQLDAHRPARARRLGRFGDKIDFANTRLGGRSVRSSRRIQLRPRAGTSSLQLDYLRPAARRRRRQALRRQPHPAAAPSTSSTSAPSCAPILQYQDVSRNTDLYLRPVRPGARAPLQPAPLLLQAEPPDRALPRLLRQPARPPGNRPHPDGPHILPEAGIRPHLLKLGRRQARPQGLP